MGFKVLGVDPSLNNFAMVRTYVAFGEEITVEDMLLVRTDREESDFDRARKIYTAFSNWTYGADIVITELPRGSQSARASWTLGIVVGILASSAVPVITVSPRQVKTVTGNKRAKKEDMLNWAVKTFPDADWYANSKGKPYKYNNHLADALAAITVSIQDKEKILDAIYK